MELGTTEDGEAAVRTAVRIAVDVAAMHARDIPPAYMEEFKRRAQQRIMYGLWSAMFDTFEQVLDSPLENQEAGL